MHKKGKEYLISAVWSVVIAISIFFGVVFGIDENITDKLLQSNSRGAISDIVVIGIDGRSLEELGAWGTWPRGIIGEVIDILNQSETGKPAVIGLDILFSGQMSKEEDEKLAKAAEAGGNVVVASSAKFQKVIDDEKLILNPMNVAGFEMPYEDLAKVTSQGHTNIIPDTDGVIRTSLHQLEGEGISQYSFAYEVYKRYAEYKELPLTEDPPVDSSGRWYIPFAGDVGEYYSGASFIEVLKGEKLPYVKDKIVLIGFYSPGTIDAYFTSVNASKKMMGVEINANIIQSYIDNEFKQLVPPLLQAIIIGILLYGITLLIWRSNLKKAFWLLVGIIAAYLASILVLYQLGYVTSVVYLPVAVIAVYITKIFSGYIEEKIMRIAVSKRFEDYIIESNIKYSKSIKDLLDSFIYTISTAIDERSPHTANHTNRMVRLAELFIDDVNAAYERGEYPECFNEQRRDVLIMSASLHDIGKLVIPIELLDKSTRLGDNLERIEQRFRLIEALEKIYYLEDRYDKQEYIKRNDLIQETLEAIKRLNSVPFVSDEDIQWIEDMTNNISWDFEGNEIKWLEDEEKAMLSIRRGTLTSQERGQIEYHVQMTYKLLKGIKFSGHLVDVAEVAGNHHEFLDGSGYPRGLSEDQLSTEVRMLTILDIYEALTAKDRPYKKPMPDEKAFSILYQMVEQKKIDKRLVSLLEKSRKEKAENEK